ncbi:MAG: hypothetical protein JW910_22735 [Anaerolineae bacterium]|nr:hypothetical protein [Anaerolineae bacterium]
MLRNLMQLPTWAQPEHPVLRYVLQRHQPQESRTRRVVRILLQVVALVVLVLLGYQLATGFGTRPAATLHAILYWPLVVLGVLVGLAAMTLTGNVISHEKGRGNWDSLRVTAHGAGLTFHARWVAAFYSLRGPLATLLLARVVFVFAILVDLAQYYGGRYLDLLISGVTPAVSLPVGAILLAALLTATLLQPLVAVGLDASIGLLVSVVVRSPRYDILVRTLLAGLRVAVVVLTILVGTQAFALETWVTPAGAWVGVLVQSIFGDQGLRLLNLEESGLLWADLPYGIFLGVALLLLTLAQAWLAGRIVSWAARLAERAE